MSVVVEKGRKVLRSCEEKEERTRLELGGKHARFVGEEKVRCNRRAHMQEPFSFGVRAFGKLLAKVTIGNRVLVTCLSQ